MRDRLSTKILSNGATRYGVYDETENLLRYEYIKLEDEPTVEGDLFSKANMLPDSIPALLGLKMANPQVKDALNVLAHVGNLHVWERVQKYSEPVPEVPAGYTFGSEQSVVSVGTSDDSSYYCTIYYADSVTVSSDGVVSLSNPSNQRNRIYDWIGSSTLAGKFCIMGEYDGSTNLVKPTENGGVVFYVPSGGTIAYNESTKQITISKYQSVTGYPYTPAIPAGTTTDYLTSTDPDAYPKQSAEGGEPEIPAHYTLADAVTVDVLSSVADYSAMVYVCDLNSIIINNDGSISTTSFSTLMGGNNALTMAGNWTKFSTTEAYYITSNSSNVVFTDTIFTVSAETTLQYADIKYVLPGCRELIGHAKVEAIPPNTTITYLGQLGGGARIEVGSYVGTGTYGKSNPNSLTFGFEPKMVIISVSLTSINDYHRGNFPWHRGDEFGQIIFSSGTLSDSTKNCALVWKGNTLSWYHKYNATSQLNKSGSVYTYTAIG